MANDEIRAYLRAVKSEPHRKGCDGEVTARRYLTLGHLVTSCRCRAIHEREEGR